MSQPDLKEETMRTLRADLAEAMLDATADFEAFDDDIYN